MRTSDRVAKFRLGQVVRHRMFPFRGVIFDVDPEFSNTEEWYQAIPEEIRPAKDQPFYHLLAENEDAYSSPTSRSKIWWSTIPAIRSSIRRSATSLRN